MNLAAETRTAAQDPEMLEGLYRKIAGGSQVGEFQAAIQALLQESPGDRLLQAWFHRLKAVDSALEKEKGRGIDWLTAVPLSILTGLIFWALSDMVNFTVADSGVPQFIFWWSPVATISALIFLARAGRRPFTRAFVLGAGLLAAAFYVVLLAPGFGERVSVEQYLILAAIHIPLLSWAALGYAVLGRGASRADRFAFLIKSVEVMITAGLYLIFGVVFGGITMGMFAALSIELPEIWIRLIAAGGFGLLPVMAVASVYDPAAPPSKQDFSQGLSRFIATMMRLLLPLTLGVLLIYLLVIPFNFFEPFENRDVLIVFNLMLFGIMGLLLGATPVHLDELSPQLQVWLRRGILAVAVLAEIVSVYAIAAVIYRTIGGGITMNRLTIIGWNTINIVLLFDLVVRLLRTGKDQGWNQALKGVFGRATIVYTAWGLFLVVFVPLLFR